MALKDIIEQESFNWAPTARDRDAFKEMLMKVAQAAIKEAEDERECAYRRTLCLEQQTSRGTCKHVRVANRYGSQYCLRCGEYA